MQYSLEYLIFVLVSKIPNFRCFAVRSIPTYHEIPTIHALLGKDRNAYLACTFKGATEADVVLTVSLLIQGQVVLTTTVPGNTGIALFAVAKVDDNLHKKQVRCQLFQR